MVLKFSKLFCICSSTNLYLAAELHNKHKLIEIKNKSSVLIQKWPYSLLFDAFW